MSWPYALIKTVATGDILLAADYNNEHTNHINNNIPSSIDDASATTPDMQTQVNPFPSGLSAATDLAGEIQRIRFMLAANAGVSYWYTTPGMSNNQLFAHTHVGTASSQCPTLDGTAAITAGTITGASIASNTLANSNLINSTIDNTKIADATIITSKIADANITLAKLATEVTAKYNPRTTNVNFTQSNADTFAQTFSYSSGPGKVHLVDLTCSASTETYSVVIDGSTVLSGTLGTTAKQWIAADGTFSSVSAYLGWEWTSSISITINNAQGNKTRTIHVSYAHN